MAVVVSEVVPNRCKQSIRIVRLIANLMLSALQMYSSKRSAWNPTRACRMVRRECEARTAPEQWP
jgi:hypothetical protein